jgi:[ribosomal protein S5]-alanine N-acetyltransferase
MHYQLRPFETEDAASFAKHANNAKITKYMSDEFPHPYTIEHAAKFIGNAMSHQPTRIFAIELDGEAVGGIGIHPQTGIYRHNAELGYWLAEPYWGKGIITNAIKEIVAYAFRDIDINRVFARPYGTNLPSAKALEKAGFILEARFEKTIFKNGEFLDELVYATRRK